MKRVTFAVLLILLVVVLGVTATQAQDYTTVISGKCGDNLTWTYDPVQNSLTISGTGPMYNYSETNKAPWVAHITKSYTPYIEEGVTTIGDYAFAYGKDSAFRMTFPSTVEYIGHKALAWFRSGNFYYLGEAPSIAEDAFEGSNMMKHYTVNWPESVKKDYGASGVTWLDADIRITPDNGQRMLALNQLATKEDVGFQLVFDAYNSIPYEPREFQVSAYDSSTYGQKDVTITADGRNFDYTFFVTDGRNHFDLVDVTFVEIPEYTGKECSCKIEVRIGTLLLVNRTDYTLSVTGTILGSDGKVTVTGMGILEGFEKTFYFPVVKRDISDVLVNTDSIYVTGDPVTTRVSLGNSNFSGKENEHYSVYYQDNINIGFGTANLVGIGNCYGINSKRFGIKRRTANEALKGKFIGMADGPLTEDFYYEEMLISPYYFQAEPDCDEKNAVAYMLYHVVGDKATLIGQATTDMNYSVYNDMSYDFSYVYEDFALQGKQSFLLAYTWVTENNEVYAGALALYVPTRVGPATSMTLSQVKNDGDFRQEYLYLTGDNGILENITWSSSDDAVATVDGGVVTFKKPGTVTIIGRCGNLTKSCKLSAKINDLTEGFIFDYVDGKARVIWDDRILEEGVDYTLSVTQKDVGTVVTATGQGLFAGQLEKVFNGLDSLADPHSHSYDDSIDQTCNGCNCSREYELVVPGDMNNDGIITNEDVVALMWYNLFPDEYPIETNGDINHDGTVNNDDVVLLMWHNLFPDEYPIS